MSYWYPHEIDLKRGEGDWQNIQPVVRKAFGAMFETISRQQAQITEMNSTIASLRQEVLQRPNYKEFESKFNDFRARLPEPVSRTEMATVQGIVREIKSDLEKKATLRYVDDAIRRKPDRYDFSSAQHSSEAMSRLSSEIADMKIHIAEIMQNTASQKNDGINISNREELGRVNDKIDDLFKLVSERPDFRQLSDKLQFKANISEIDNRLKEIGDSAAAKYITRLEDAESAIYDHERRLTKIELIEGNQTLGMVGITTKLPSSRLNFDTKENISAHSNIKSVSEGRKSAELECMMMKLNAVGGDIQAQIHTTTDLKSRLDRIEGHYVKLSGLVDNQTIKVSHTDDHLNELQRRLSDFQNDSLSSIDSIERKMAVSESKIERELSKHMSATQSAVLTIIEAFQKDSKNELHKLKDYVDAYFEKKLVTEEDLLNLLKQIDTRFEEIKEGMSRSIDLTGTKFTSIKAVAGAIKGLKQTVKALADVVVQQNSKYYSEVNSNEILICKLKEELARKVSNCENEIKNLSSIETEMAVSQQRLGNLEGLVAAINDSNKALGVKLAELNGISQHFMSTKSAAISSATVAATATAVMEDLAADSFRNRSKDVIGEKKTQTHSIYIGEQSISESIAAAEAIQRKTMEMQQNAKLDYLRNEKLRLTRELFGSTSNSR